MRRAALLFALLPSIAFANRDGWADAQSKAERLERRGDFAAAAAWWEAAAETMRKVEIPSVRLGDEQADEDGDPALKRWWKDVGNYALEDLKKAELRAADLTRRAGKVDEAAQKEARAALAGWIAADANNFWEVERAELRLASLREAGDHVGVARLEMRLRQSWALRLGQVAARWAKSVGDPKAEQEFLASEKKQADLARHAEAAAMAARAGGPQSALAAAIARNDRSGVAEQVARLGKFRDLAAVRSGLSGVGLELGQDAIPALVAAGEFATLARWNAEDLATGAKGVVLRQIASSPPQEEWIAWSTRAVTEGTEAEKSLAAALLTGWSDTKVADGWKRWLEGATKPGLSVSLFPSPELKGEAKRQTWEDVDLDCGLASPVEGLPVDGWSFRATGLLKVENEIVAELLVTCDDAVRVRVDNRVVIDEWTAAPEPLVRRAPVVLDPGWHSIVVEYADREGVATLKAWLAPLRGDPIPLGPMLRHFEAGPK